LTSTGACLNDKQHLFLAVGKNATSQIAEIFGYRLCSHGMNIYIHPSFPAPSWIEMVTPWMNFGRSLKVVQIEAIIMNFDFHCSASFLP